MPYTRKQHGKKSKMSRNIRNRNYKKNNKKNKKYSGGVAPALTFSTATKAGLLGKKAISAVKVGSKISKGKLSDVGVGLLDDALLHTGNYFFGKKGKKMKKNKKQKGGDIGAIDALKTTLKTADKIPGITIFPAYKIFAGIKDKLINLLDIVQNQDIQTVLNNQEMPTEEIKKKIKIIISKNENIKAEIDKYKEVCSKLDSILDEIKKIEIMGNKIGEGFGKNIEAQLEKAIPHRKELFSAFTEFDVNEKLEIENPEKTTDDVLENDTNIDTQESKDNVIEENTIEIENPDNSTGDVLENNTNIDTQESKDNVIEENTIEIENPDNSTGDVLENNTNIDESNKNTNEIIDESDNIENTVKETNGDAVLENSDKNKNCAHATGISGFLLGNDALICYPNKQEGAGSRKNKKSKKSKKSNKKPRKGSRKTKKSHKLHKKK